MTKAPFSTRLAISIARRLLNKYRSVYLKQHRKSLPIILIAGTAGKSSTTLLLKGLFNRAGYKVFTGANPKACLNSLTGLTMVLGEFESEFEGRGAFVHKMIFLLKGYWAYLTKSVELPKDSIIVYEIGFNEQHEANYFLEVFDGEVDSVVITNLTYEHSFGFSEEFDQHSYGVFKQFIPEYWQQALEDESLDGRLRNIALEQFKLLSLSKHYITPLVIGAIDNGILSNFDSTEMKFYPEVTRSANYELETEGYTLGSQLLLPQTFAKNATILDTIATRYKFSKSITVSALEQMEVPNGRFSLLNGKSGSRIVDSTYNSDPASLSGFLMLFEEVCGEFIKQSRSGELPEPYGIAPKHTLILGEMRELGEMSREEHKKILDSLVKLTTVYADYLQDIFLVGQQWLQIDDEVSKSDGDVSYIRHLGQLFKVYRRAGDINRVLTDEYIRSGSWYWVKGSQNTIFLEIVVEHLLANKQDKSRLCRRGEAWDLQRKKFL
jgi:UDP-N-acetylmuramyl pentapeptide synthase